MLKVGIFSVDTFIHSKKKQSTMAINLEQNYDHKKELNK